jgi:nitrogen regulatory protein P-II 1
MKIVIAMIQPFKLQDVTLALESIPGFPGMTVSDARGFGREHLEGSHGRLENLTDFTPCVRVEIIVEDGSLDSVVETLVTAAHTGRRGDGKVVVCPVERSYDVQRDGSEK